MPRTFGELEPGDALVWEGKSVVGLVVLDKRSDEEGHVFIRFLRIDTGEPIDDLLPSHHDLDGYLVFPC